MNPATLTVQFRGYLKTVHCSSTPILKSLPQSTSVPRSHNHSALWSSSLFYFHRLTQNQRSILELSVSPDRQKRDSGFPASKVQHGLQTETHRHIGPSHNGKAKPALYYEQMKMAAMLLPRHDTWLKGQRQADLTQDKGMHHTALDLLRSQ